MPVLGAAAWLGAVAGTLARGGWLLVALATAVLLAVAATAVARRYGASVGTVVVAALLVAAAAGSVAALRAAQVAHNPVAALADEGAAVTVVGTVTSDPRQVAGGFADQVVWRLELRAVSGRGRTVELATPVLVLDDADATRVPLGATVRLRGRLAPADGRDLAALLLPSGDPEVRRRHPVRGGGPRQRCGRRCATRWRTGPPTSGRWCRRWSTATTRGSTRDCRRHSGPPG